MSEFNDPFPNYEMLAHHDEAHGKIARKKLWKVFWLLLLITLFEVFVGIMAPSWDLHKTTLKIIFIGLTIVKAYYIVYTFMHLGEEESWTKWIIIGPYAVFILYLVFMMTIGEGNYAKIQRIDEPMSNDKIPTTVGNHEAGSTGTHEEHK